LAAGIAVNVKVHAVVYFVPIAVFTFRQKRFPGLVIAAGIAILTICIPFLFPNVSLKNYADTMRQASQHGLSVVELRNLGAYILSFCVFAMCLGLCVFRTPKRLIQFTGGEHSAYFLAMIVAVGLICIPASKYGSGPHHLMPFFPILAVGAGRAISQTKWNVDPRPFSKQVLLIILVSWLASCYASGIQRIRIERKAESLERYPPLAGDIEHIIGTYGKEYLLLCGAGSDAGYSDTYSRPLLVFAGFPISLDPGALMERKRAGTALPALSDFLEDIQKGRSTVKPVMWLIPRGSDPFSMHTAYPPADCLFSSAFREDFKNTFSLKAATQYFDLYTKTLSNY
jgi:hypothetical protein